MMTDQPVRTDDIEETVEHTMIFDPGDFHELLGEEKVHTLVQQEGRDAGRCIELGEATLCLGRSDAADIKLSDPRISTRHCELRLEGGFLQVTDLNSTNGTFVDQRRIQGSATLPVSSRLSLGGCVFIHEVRTRRDLNKSREMHTDLRKACDYVRALLPLPLSEGPVQTDWAYVPSSILGGDAFGYHELDENRMAFYLLDVCGHGAGAAMHSVSVISMLRQQSLSAVDFGNPAEVLRALNKAFDMDRHGGMYFTIWYGVYDRRTRLLVYASAGHPPALLVGPDRREAVSLQVRCMSIGTWPDQAFKAAETVVPPGGRLYLFSDGVFEIVTHEGRDWDLDGFRRLVLEGGGRTAGEADRLLRSVERLSRTAGLADDFSLLIAHFN